MKSFFQCLSAFVSLVLISVVPASAERFVPEGYCAIVLASKPSVAEAASDVRERWSDRDVTIYQSRNGWYAITSRVIKAETSDAILAAGKAEGRVPKDALCSTGRAYVRRVTGFAAKTTNERDDMWATANAYALSGSDKRFIQLALAFKGTYHGLLDGDWGRLSQEAFEAFTSQEYSSSPKNWHLALLAVDTFGLIERDGWAMYHSEWLGMSYLFPFDAFREGEESDIFLNYEHRNTSLRISLARTGQDRVNNLHEYVLNGHADAAAPYTARRTNFAVTAARLSNGSYLYARSRFVKGLWSTVMVSANRSDRVLYQAVTASIADGFAAPIIIQKGGFVDNQIREAIAFVERESEDSEQAIGPGAMSNARPKPSREKSSGSSGSGFFVDQNGIVLTNAHVVDGCSSITVNGQPAHLRDQSETFDLALLEVETGKQQDFATFAPTPAELNSDVTVTGYPLSGLLGGLNVTRGSVSSTKGISGDNVNMQISAPVQAGNSGGPVIDRHGQIVGVVVSKLNNDSVKNLYGDTPQNVNFAIRSEIAKLYLFQNGISPTSGTETMPIDPVALAKSAASFTVLIKCD